MSKINGPSHIVVDGSNIATEGRSRPSLAQLNEAVTSFMADHPDAAVTVVVDATFGHRIDPSERSEFDEAVANNELVAPPAGAIGRGDAFVLTIADKAGATILSNDSFQEFHADYEWLFDEGRLVGGKPVPHVGWVFVARTPVRGPVSRKVTKQAKKGSGSTKASGRPSKEASQPMPVPTAPPPGLVTVATPPASARSPKGSPTNDLMPFLDFVEHHPVGTSCSGLVESYSSHGAYLRVGEVVVYLPLRMMADPAPRSARSVLTLGEAVTVVVTAITASKRSIDVAMPDMAGSAGSGREVASDSKAPAAKKVAAKKAIVKRASAKKVATTTAAQTAPDADKNVASARDAGVNKAAPSKKAAAKKSPAKKAPVKNAPVKKTPVKKDAAKKPAPAKKAAAKTAPAKKSQSTTSAAKKVASKKVRS